MTYDHMTCAHISSHIQAPNAPSKIDPWGAAHFGSQLPVDPVATTSGYQRCPLWSLLRWDAKPHELGATNAVGINWCNVGVEIVQEE